jgi:hypothetical protein
VGVPLGSLRAGTSEAQQEEIGLAALSCTEDQEAFSNLKSINMICIEIVLIKIKKYFLKILSIWASHVLFGMLFYSKISKIFEKSKNCPK